MESRRTLASLLRRGVRFSPWSASWFVHDLALQTSVESLAGSHAWRCGYLPAIGWPTPTEQA
jgi:hypothetical protein